MNKFWNFIRDDAGERVLRLEGPIDEDNLWGDAITPEMFRDELEAEEGDVTVWLNSPGGNVFCADQIYNMLLAHNGKVTVKIDAIAASAASVIAMAGDTVLISPVGMIMVHDPMTIAMGNTKDMEAAIKTLNEVKESIINAYQRKTGLSRNKIAQLMSDETWLNARKAKEMGFADDILFGKEAEEKQDGEKEEEGVTAENTWQPYHAKIMGQAIWAGLTGKTAEGVPTADVSDAESEKASDKETDVESSETGVSGNSVRDKPEKKPEEEPDGGGDAPDEETPGEEDPDRGDDPDKAGPDENPDKEGNPEEGEPDKDNPDDPKKKKPENTITDTFVIGMDGKTKDGAMPYELLRRELDLLR